MSRIGWQKSSGGFSTAKSIKLKQVTAHLFTVRKTWAVAIVCWLGCSGMSGPVAAHHGGIGIEGDLVEWALNIDQWQEEQIDQGYRIKFLAYPRQPVRGGRTRLVFEIQAVTTGQYVGGLAMQLRIQPPAGAARTVSLPETTGVTAYYETAVEFVQVGAYSLTAISKTPEASFQATFQRHVSPSVLLGDWATITGNLTVLATFTVTWVGLIVAVQRRFTTSQVGPNS